MRAFFGALFGGTAIVPKMGVRFFSKSSKTRSPPSSSLQKNTVFLQGDFKSHAALEWFWKWRNCPFFRRCAMCLKCLHVWVYMQNRYFRGMSPTLGFLKSFFKKRPKMAYTGHFEGVFFSKVVQKWIILSFKKWPTDGLYEILCFFGGPFWFKKWSIFHLIL